MTSALNFLTSIYDRGIGYSQINKERSALYGKPIVAKFNLLIFVQYFNIFIQSNHNYFRSIQSFNFPIQFNPEILIQSNPKIFYSIQS